MVNTYAIAVLSAWLQGIRADSLRLPKIPLQDLIENIPVKVSVEAATTRAATVHGGASSSAAPAVTSGEQVPAPVTPKLTLRANAKKDYWIETDR